MKKLLIIFLLFLYGCSYSEEEYYEIEEQEIEPVIEFDVTDVYMEEVDSSAFEYIGYDEDCHKLVLVFRPNNDRCYIYDVDYEVYYDLINADSIGGYYNKYIKGIYPEADRIDNISVSGHTIVVH